MSLELSRGEHLPVNIDKYRAHIINSWHIQSLTDRMYSQDKTQSTINMSALNAVGKHLGQYFSGTPIKVLEVFAGNCIAGATIRSYLRPVTWMYTDIAKYKTGGNAPFNKLDSVAAVQLFGPAADALLMISPPFSETNDVTSTSVNLGYGDYFACRDFIAQSEVLNTPKYIVFIGELGASDGSTGMYQYMMTNPRLVLELRKTILSTKDVLGGKMEKEVFVFKIV